MIVVSESSGGVAKGCAKGGLVSPMVSWSGEFSRSEGGLLYGEPPIKKYAGALCPEVLLADSGRGW